MRSDIPHWSRQRFGTSWSRKMSIFVCSVGHDIATGLPDGAHAISTFLHTSRCQPLPAARTHCGIIQYFTGMQSGLQDHKSLSIWYPISREHSGVPSQDHGYACLGYILRGIRHTQGARHSRPRRRPITLTHIHTMYEHIDGIHHKEDAYMLKAAITVAYFGMLRVSEYTCTNTHRYDADWNLMQQDIFAMQHMVIVHIKSWKTDLFRVSVSIRIAATSHTICPVRWVWVYLQSRRESYGPIFMFRNGRFLVRNDIAKLIKNSLDEINLNTHSLWAGGATNLANLGVPDYVIQIMGRWRSDAYKRYLHFSDAYISQLHARMATPRTANWREWDTHAARLADRVEER